MRVRAAVHWQNVLHVPHSVRPVRYQARSERSVLREHGGGAVRQRPARGMGRGEAASVRVVQRLRKDRLQAAYGHRRPGRHSIRFQR